MLDRFSVVAASDELLNDGSDGNNTDDDDVGAMEIKHMRGSVSYNISWDTRTSVCMYDVV